MAINELGKSPGCEELDKGYLGRNHIIGYFPGEGTATTIFNFDYHLLKAHKRNLRRLRNVGGALVPIGATMNTQYFFFSYCPICGEKIDVDGYKNLIYSRGKLY